jgi:hypothetical protein
LQNHLKLPARVKKHPIASASVTSRDDDQDDPGYGAANRRSQNSSSM